MSLVARLHHIFGEFLKGTDDDVLRASNNRSFAIGKWDEVPSPASEWRGVPFRTEGEAGVADTYPLCYWDGSTYRMTDLIAGAASARSYTVIANGMGSEISDGAVGDLYVWSPATIVGVALLADQDGDITFDLYRDTYGAYPPTSGDSIVGASPPAISSNRQYLDTTLTGWDTSLSAGDTLRVVVDSCTTITRCTLTLALRSDA